jgi:hypothetical protein
MEGGQNDHIGPGAFADVVLEGDAPASSAAESIYAQGHAAGVRSVRRLDVEAIARTCHAVNRAYSRSIGDNSHEPWESAPDWQRDSAIKGVNAALDGVSDEELHQLWCDEKHQGGWVYGEVKDATAKTHPCLVPYNELDSDTQLKDTLFRTVVESLKPYL